MIIDLSNSKIFFNIIIIILKIGSNKTMRINTHTHTHIGPSSSLQFCKTNLFSFESAANRIDKRESLQLAVDLIEENQIFTKYIKSIAISFLSILNWKICSIFYFYHSDRKRGRELERERKKKKAWKSVVKLNLEYLFDCNLSSFDCRFIVMKLLDFAMNDIP